MTAAISMRGLVKSFGHIRALDGLDLAVHTTLEELFMRHYSAQVPEPEKQIA
jgi:hypothetical protein